MCVGVRAHVIFLFAYAGTRARLSECEFEFARVQRLCVHWHAYVCERVLSCVIEALSACGSACIVQVLGAVADVSTVVVMCGRVCVWYFVFESCRAHSCKFAYFRADHGFDCACDCVRV